MHDTLVIFVLFKDHNKLCWLLKKKKKLVIPNNWNSENFPAEKNIYLANFEAICIYIILFQEKNYS